MTTFTAVEGEGLTEDDIIAEAYTHVAEGFRRALEVEGLPELEVTRLRACLRNATFVAREPAMARLSAEASQHREPEGGA